MLVWGEIGLLVSCSTGIAYYLFIFTLMSFFFFRLYICLVTNNIQIDFERIDINLIKLLYSLNRLVMDKFCL